MSVEVPPGHRVVIIHPLPDPFFTPTESGPIMLNFGSVENVPSVLTKITDWAGATKEQQSVLWLMPANILPAFDDAPAVLAQITNLVAAAPHVSHLAVFPGSSSPLLERVMESFRSVGISTQRGAPDGSCYVEVHKPDGTITIGIPGPDSPVDESEPGSDLDKLINEIADHNREDDFLKLVSDLPSLRLFLPVKGPLPENLPHGERITLKGEFLAFRTASVQGLECAITFTSNSDPRLDPECAVMIDGLEAFQMVLKTTLDGLLIQSKGTGWVIIQRKQIEQILSQQTKPSLSDQAGRLLSRIFSKPKRK